jgi:hypothetical protein
LKNIFLAFEDKRQFFRVRNKTGGEKCQLLIPKIQPFNSLFTIAPEKN